MQLTNSEELFGIKHQVLCDNNERCKLDIVNITDVQSSAVNKVQVYISGALHGNERIGPHASYYLIELLVSNFGIDPFITNLLKTREIIITPMTNAPGFFYNEREERMAGDALKVSFNERDCYFLQSAISIDINRDFPYN